MRAIARSTPSCVLRGRRRITVYRVQRSTMTNKTAAEKDETMKSSSQCPDENTTGRASINRFPGSAGEVWERFGPPFFLFFFQNRNRSRQRLFTYLYTAFLDTGSPCRLAYPAIRSGDQPSGSFSWTKSVSSLESATFIQFVLLKYRLQYVLCWAFLGTYDPFTCFCESSRAMVFGLLPNRLAIERILSPRSFSVAI